MLKSIKKHSLKSHKDNHIRTSVRMTEDENLVSYLLLLRFGPSFDNQFCKPILNYTSIAKLVKKPVQTVRGLILFGISRLKQGIQIGPSQKKKLT
jgi:hypothetical protein